jgi:hypothetical protein
MTKFAEPGGIFRSADDSRPKRPTAAHARASLTRMTHSDDKPLPAVGAYWIEEADYPAVLKIFDDGNTLPRTWNEWLKIAEEMEKGLKAYGHPVLRVRIDPATFPAWCVAHGTTPGRQGRKVLVAAAVKERYGEQD